MKLENYDSFIIGICLASSISFFFEKDFIGIAIQGFILGVYFGIKWIENKFAEQKGTAEVKG